MIALLTFLIGLSALWSIGPEITAILGATMALLWIGVFLVLWNSWETEEEILGLCNTLFVLATLVFLLEGVYQIFGLGRATGHQRYAGVFWNPNSLGTAVAFLSPFVYWKHRVTQSSGVKLLAKVLGLIMLSSLLLSGSRSGLLGTIVCMGAIVTYVHRARAAIAASVIVPPLLLLAILAPRLDNEVLDQSAIGTRIIRPDSLGTLSDRVGLWQEGYALFEKHPWVGWGFGMNKFAAIGRANEELWRAMVKLGNLNYHNTYLQLGMDLGVVGVLVFSLFLFSVLSRGLVVFRSGKHTSLELAGMAFFGAFLALFGDSFVHGWAFAPGNSMSITFWLVSAAIIRVRVFQIEGGEQEARVEAFE